MKAKPTQEQAHEAEEALSNAILEFSSNARAPWERNTPDESPLWIPRISTLRYSPIRGGGFIWSMDANDQQIVAYYVNIDGSSFVQVTAHGQARHNFHEMLRRKHLFPTASPWIEWFDWKARYEMDSKMRKKVVW